MITVLQLAKYLEGSDSNELFRDISERITFGITPEDKKNTLARFILGIPEIPRTRTRRENENVRNGLEQFYLEERPEFHPELTQRDYQDFFTQTFEYWTSIMTGETIQEKIEQAKDYLAKQISRFNSKKYNGIFELEETKLVA